MFVRNMLLNSSFEIGVDNWKNKTWPTIITDEGFHGNQCASLTCSDSTTWKYMASSPFSVTPGHKYFFGVSCRGTTVLTSRMLLYNPGPPEVYWSTVQIVTDLGWATYSGLTTCPSDLYQAQMLLYADVGSAQGSSNCIYFDAAFMVDLSEIFGLGNEPSYTWCKAHIVYAGDQCEVLADGYFHDLLISQLGTPLKDICISKINVTGTPEIYEFATFWQPVYDRVAADCVYGNPKGCLDSKVFNRIEYNMRYLQYALNKQGLNPFCYLHDATIRSFYLRVTTWNNLKQSILNCKEFYAKVASFPGISLSKAGELLTYSQVNDIEYIQWLLFEYLQNLEGGAYCMNDLYVGDYLFGGDGA